MNHGLGSLSENDGLGPLALVLNGSNLSTVRQRPFANRDVIMLENRALGVFEGAKRVVVLDDGVPFVAESIGPHALRFQQEIERAAARQELLESGIELLGRRFALSPLGNDELIEFGDVHVFQGQELVRPHFLIL